MEVIVILVGPSNVQEKIAILKNGNKKVRKRV